MRQLLITCLVSFNLFSPTLVNAGDLNALTNSVMNGWRADYKREMGSLISSSGCSASVNLTKLTNSVMNGWRADYKRQAGNLMNCASN